MPKIASFFKNPKWLLAAIYTCLFYVAVLPHNESVAFVLPYESHEALRLAFTLKLFFLPTLFGIVYFFLNFVQRVAEKNQFYRNWLKLTLIYAVVMLLFFALLYPGHWVGDEFDILEAVRHYSLYSWQNFFTNIFYTFCLYIIPSGVGIVIIQLGFISLTIGYVIALSRNFFKRNNTHYLLFLPFLFFPVIINNFYPLRLTMFSYLLLLAVAQIIFLYTRVLTPTQPQKYFIGAALIIAIICFWRTEGLLYLVLLPLYAHALGLLNIQSLKRLSTYISFLLGSAIIAFAFYITSLTTSDKYQITATLNPLSTMVQKPLKGSATDKDLKEINKVVDLSVVKRYPSYDEIPAFWNGAVRNDYYNHLQGYNSHVYDIFLSNPDSFINNRVQVFLHTNSFGATPSLGPGQFYNPDPAVVQKVQHFYDTNKLSKPLSLRLKLAVTKRLLLVNDSYNPSFIAKLVWSIIPTCLGILTLLVVSILRRKWLFALISSLLLTHIGLIFMTAPANYFMYYLPVYLVGNFILAVLFLRSMEVKLPRLYRQLDLYLAKNLTRHRRYIFLAIGMINTLLDFLFYTFLTSVILRSPDQIVLIGILSGTFALGCAYTTHKLVTWRDKPATSATLIKFFAFTGFGLWVIRPFLLSWFMTFTPLYAAIENASRSLNLPFSNHFIVSTGAFVIMVLIVMIYNYYTYAQFVFNTKRAQP